MHQTCRLLYAFATPYKDDMTNEYLSSPKDVITEVSVGEKRSMMVTFGLYATYGKALNIYTAIYKEGKSESLDNSRKSSFQKNLRGQYLDDGMGVFMISIKVQDVNFESDGIYEVNVKVFPEDAEPTQENKFDEIHSFFYVLTQKDS